MHPEQRVRLHGVEVAIELQVVLVLELPGAAAPGGNPPVEGLSLELHRHRHEVAIGVHQLADAGGFEVFEFLLLQMQHHIRARFLARSLLEAEAGRTVAAPAHGGSTWAGAATDQIHPGRHHEAGIEAQAEVADDGVAFMLVLLQELLGTGEGHLVDVATHLIGRHADAVVTDGEGLGLPVDADPDHPLGTLVAVPGHGRQAAFVDGIEAVADQLPEEDLMAGVDGLLDDRKDVFRMDLDLSLLQDGHGTSLLSFSGSY